MSERVTMPALGESVTEGTVTRWLKSVGDRVEVDEPLLEVSTDKVDTEIPSPVAGVLEEILAEEDETVEVGADLAVIGDGSGAEGSASDDDSADTQPEEPQQDEGGQDEPEQGEAAAAAAPSDEPEEAPEPAPAQADSAGESSRGEVSGGETVTMPALGESVTEGTVTRWLKQEGDEVAVDEPLLEVSTDKVDTEIPSPVAGTVTKILAQEDETVEVGGALAIVGGSVEGGGDSGAGSADTEQAGGDEEPEAGSSEAEAAEDAGASEAETPVQAATEPEPEPEPKPEPAKAEQSAPQEAAEKEAPKTSDTSQPQEQSGGDAAGYVTPLVRKLAADHGIDLSSLSGTGIGGRIRKQDVLAAAEEAKKAEEKKAEEARAQEATSEEAAAPAQQAAATAPAAQQPASRPSADASGKRGTTEKMSRLRQTIAKRMVESLQVSAQLTTVVEVDVSRIARLRDQAKADFARREGTKLSYLPFFALASVEALKAHPTINASVDGAEITYHGAEHLGVAVDTERGLLVPVIRDAGDLNIAGLARKIADLAARTRDSKITPDELSGGTFTITNTGSRGALFDTPIINQPQVAILGTGAVVKRPVVIDDGSGGSTIAVRPMVYLALSYDHRVVDGADAARFLTTIKNRLEEGAFEADLGL
ncbi:2-oxoglutarate dehydrogenase, E2 component, dihydrolipoamide succinyltransferase [Nostocoides sp. F2B08]|uniref:2-oxoglutarate dehydrogenase, E2 component, dihydrolipoamide succinyltransferase n=1 Tax=Nostocoides sp. F2B08 TaxID=2653936 RepID=UPI001262E8E1|nr:2-oxoglutarate dehydrogenase, E2 component, dihydrolipoamide succinyltransferase [Tetrasphaera sp. F2B08]KAB7742486.1 2-oxoglutarate dehydrogenase, E2 component, dihydrolipoamide succinyltransferase [Tetrasphaera sp. F2B08]